MHLQDDTPHARQMLSVKVCVQVLHRTKRYKMVPSTPGTSDALMLIDARQKKTTPRNKLSGATDDDSIRTTC
jgi:hypothetical protein